MSNITPNREEVKVCKHGSHKGECKFPHCDFREIGNPEWKDGSAPAEAASAGAARLEDSLTEAMIRLWANPPYVNTAEAIRERAREFLAEAGLPPEAAPRPADGTEAEPSSIEDAFRSGFSAGARYQENHGELADEDEAWAEFLAARAKAEGK